MKKQKLFRKQKNKKQKLFMGKQVCFMVTNHDLKYIADTMHQLTSSVRMIIATVRFHGQTKVSIASKNRRLQIKTNYVRKRKTFLSCRAATRQHRSNPHEPSIK